MRILITGGFGYIGSILAVHLSKLGHEIILGTRKKAIPPEWLPKSSVISMDWLNYEGLSDYLREVDLIIHSAGMNYKDCIEDPIRAMEFNGYNTGRLAAAALRADVKKFIFLSTVHVYSSSLIGNFSENSIPINENPYAKSKLIGEEQIFNILGNTNVKFLILRLSNIFGPPVHKNLDNCDLIANTLSKDITRGNDIFIKNPFQCRDFLGVTDFKYFFSKILEFYFEKDIINLCSSQYYLIKDFANLLNNTSYKLYGSKVKVSFEKDNSENINNFLYIKSKLPFKLGIDNFDNDVENLIHFFKKNF